MRYYRLGFSMVQLTLSVVLIAWVQCITSELDTGEELVVLVLLPLTGEVGYIGQSAKIDIEETLLEVNRNESILQGYALSVKWVDTKCDMASTTKAVFDRLSEGDNIVFIYGGFCSSVTKPIAESMLHFDLWQISFANTDPTLSDVATYTNFLRVIPNDLDFNIVAVQFLQFYDWRRVALLFQDATSGDDTYAYTNSDMISLLKGEGIEYTSDSVDEGPMAALQRIVDSDSRIIIANVDHTMAQKTLCLGYHMGMFGYKYVWLISQASTFPSEWWKGSSNCTTDQIVEALQGHFSINILYTFHSQSYQGIYSPEDSARVSLSNQYSAFAQDGVWLMAHSLDSFIQTNHTPDWSKWHQLSDPSFVMDEEFQGSSGLVKFSGRRRLGSLLLNQWRDGDYSNVGRVDMSTDDNMTLYTDKIWWHGRSTPPLDSMIKVEKIEEPNAFIQSSLMALASIGLLLAFAFLVINIKYADHRYIKMSSPKMNNIILVGCILVYSSIYMARVNPALASVGVLRVMCTVRIWTLSLGFSLAFGPLFAKTWRVYMIFHSPQRKNKLITDAMLLALVTTLLVIDLIILITWASVHPLYIKQVPLIPIEEENRLIEVFIYKCVSDKRTIWAVIIYLYKGLLLVIGCFFAWQTRHVNIPALNDSKYIGLSVYNVVIMCTSAVAISYVLKSEQDYCDLISGLLIITCTTITLCLVFVPKIMHLLKDPQSAAPRPRLASKHKSLSKKSILSKQLTMEEFTTTEVKVAQLEQEVAANELLLEQAKERLDQLTAARKAKLKRTNMYSITSSLSFTATIAENLTMVSPSHHLGEAQSKV